MPTAKRLTYSLKKNRQVLESLGEPILHHSIRMKERARLHPFTVHGLEKRALRRLALPEDYNVANALAVIAVMKSDGVFIWIQYKDALSCKQGCGQEVSFLDTFPGYHHWMIDYAHNGIGHCAQSWRMLFRIKKARRSTDGFVSVLSRSRGRIVVEILAEAVSQYADVRDGHDGLSLRWRSWSYHGRSFYRILKRFQGWVVAGDRSSFFAIFSDGWLRAWMVTLFSLQEWAMITHAPSAVLPFPYNEKKRWFLWCRRRTKKCAKRYFELTDNYTAIESLDQGVDSCLNCSRLQHSENLTVPLSSYLFQ